LLGEIQNALLDALDDEHRRRGLTRAGIARIIGRNKSFVTRKLNGQGNITIETLADLAFALDRLVKVKLPSRVAAQGSNIAPETITSMSSTDVRKDISKDAPITTRNNANISVLAA
jgi:transcriptional regulator with XRE-family HTH domain